MKIALKLFASLTDRLPPEARARHRVELDVEPGTTVLDVIRRERIPESQCFLVLVDGALRPLTEFLTDVFWKDVRDTIAVYNLATGVRFTKKAKEAEAQAELMRETPREKALAGLERLLVTSRKVGVVVEYAETIAPSGVRANGQPQAARRSSIVLSA